MRPTTYEKQICPICGKPLVKHGVDRQGNPKFYCKRCDIEFTADGNNLVSDGAEVFEGAFKATAAQEQANAKEQETKQLYADMCRVLTDFENPKDGSVATAEDLYGVLVRVQNWFAQEGLDN